MSASEPRAKNQATASNNPESAHQRTYRELRERYWQLPYKSKMSNWYDVFSLFGTVRDIVVSDVFRERVDYRTLSAFREHSARERSASLPDPSTVASQEVAPEPVGSQAAPAGVTAGEPIAAEGVFIDRQKFVEYQNAPGSSELWFDYASDVGDGFNSTYYVATQLGRPSLELEGIAESLPRGRFLILGGDEVYPSATRELYEQRFIRPYEAACYQPSPPDRKTAPHLYAIPGNHDWYDGLASFMSVFGERRAIGSWRTHQRQSYFAIKLPHDLWIFAVDIGLGGELDESQVQYFQDLVRTEMKQKGRLILCLAEPDWVKTRPNVQNLRDGLFYLERKLVDARGPSEPLADVRVILRLAGDLHHYRRHQSEEAVPASDLAVASAASAESAASVASHSHDDMLPRQGPIRVVENITAGGGGAFLHPTHELALKAEGQVPGQTEGDSMGHPPKQPPLRFRCKAAFPDFATSRALTWKNLLFFLRNPRMWLVLWCVYGPLLHLGFWLLGKGFPADSCVGGACAGAAMASRIGLFALLGAVCAGLTSGCIAFATSNATGEVGEAKKGRGRTIHFSQSRRTKAKWIGLFHGLTQSLVFGSVMGVGGLQYLRLQGYLLQLDPFWQGFSPVTRLVCSVAAAFVAALLTMFVFGGYLLLALNLRSLRLHANDAFASLREESYKNFLRIKLTADELTIYPIGFKRVPTKWHLVRASHLLPHHPLFNPAQKEADTEPFLIESVPIRVRLRDEEQAPAVVAPAG